MKEFPNLQTRRLVLRAFQPADAQAVIDSFSQEAVTRYTNHAPMQSIQEAKEMVEMGASIFDRGVGIR